MLTGCAEGDSGGDGGDVSGQTVKIAGGITGTEADAAQQDVRPVHQRHRHQGRVHRGQELRGKHRHQGGRRIRPRHRDRPQPGLLKTLIETGEVQEASEAVRPTWTSTGTRPGSPYGSGRRQASTPRPCSPTPRARCTASPSVRRVGREVPKTWTSLLTLTKTIQEDRQGLLVRASFAADAASGWPRHRLDRGDLVLRQRPAPEVTTSRPPTRWKFYRRRRDQGRVRRRGEILLNPDARQRRTGT